MGSLLNLWSAIANLARSLNRLATVADAVANEAEQRIEITKTERPELANGRARKAELAK